MILKAFYSNVRFQKNCFLCLHLNFVEMPGILYFITLHTQVLKMVDTMRLLSRVNFAAFFKIKTEFCLVKDPFLTKGVTIKETLGLKSRSQHVPCFYFVYKLVNWILLASMTSPKYLSTTFQSHLEINKCLYIYFIYWILYVLLFSQLLPCSKIVVPIIILVKCNGPIFKIYFKSFPFGI